MSDRCKHDVPLTRVCVECEKRIRKLKGLPAMCESPMGSAEGLYVCVRDSGHLSAHSFDHEYVRVRDGAPYVFRCAIGGDHEGPCVPAPAAPGAEALESPQEAEFRAIAIMCCRFDKDYERLMGLHHAIVDAARQEERETARRAVKAVRTVAHREYAPLLELVAEWQSAREERDAAFEADAQSPDEVRCVASIQRVEQAEAALAAWRKG